MKYEVHYFPGNKATIQDITTIHDDNGVPQPQVATHKEADQYRGRYIDGGMPAVIGAMAEFLPPAR